MQATEEREAVAPAAADPTLVLGRYRLRERLGSGGFGTVYAARDERLDRPVAIKVMPADRARPSAARREAIAVARLDHPGIVALFDAGEEGGARYLVSELVDGRTLGPARGRRRALGPRRPARRAGARRRARPRPRARRDPPRRQAAERDRPRRGGSAARRRQAHRLRRRAPGRRGAADAHRRRGRHARLHGARAGRRAPAAARRRPLLARARALRGAGRRQPRQGGEPAATAAARHRLAPLRRAAATCRRSSARRSTARCARPEERGTLDDLYDALADALPSVSDEGGTIAPHPLERGLPVLPPALARPSPPPRPAASPRRR